jgi:titin
VRIEDAASTGNIVAWNYIGTDATGRAPLGNSVHGVRASDGAVESTVGPYNLIAYNGASGVMISGADTEGIVVTQNSVHDNYDLEIYLAMSGNNDNPHPTITATALGSVEISGTACAGCTVEVFGNSIDTEAGEHYLGTTFADLSGDWVLSLGGLAHPYITATATDTVNGTSMFSHPFTATVRSLFLPLILRQFP